ncbi:hypothetical protein [Poseidonocella sp. HB161398]|uniref:hypothetical protein n=1 Tax=Poseidonocella sp. HB161398 TaxID=2320855 RepID=UPI0014875D28|nr:hypothetical protein [Poseidonocella sp. HB161398]
MNEPGVFTMLPGYEWSGNTAGEGDRNVFFPGKNAQTGRCSHALVAEHGDMDADAQTLADLQAKLHAEPVEAAMQAHAGGRHANIHVDHEPRPSRCSPPGAASNGC